MENGGNDGKGSERGLEYDTMSDRFARFINDEVLPAVLSNTEIKAAYPNIAFTENPWGKGVMGCSSGGAAALTMGWFRPDLFRRLITYSGTFVDQQDDDAPEEAKYPLGAWEYHSSMKLIENSEKKPLRIFTHVSENDNRAKDPEETYHNWVMANETHRRGPQGQRLRLPLRLQQGHGALRRQSIRANAGGYTRLDVARLRSEVAPAGKRRPCGRFRSNDLASGWLND